nr:hypothetical protein [Tanacetum cinerariifolium]
MESLNPQVVSAAKLPILNPNEFDLWKMRIEQYFLMTDYSLWEVILNGDSHAPTRVVEEDEVKSSSNASTSTQNIAFVSSNTDSTNEPVSAATSVSAVSAKLPVSALLNVDTLRDRLEVADGHVDCESQAISLEDRKESWSKWPYLNSVMVWAAMTGVFRQKSSLPTMHSWHSPLPVLTMRYNSGDGYHAVPPPYTGTFMPPKANLVFNKVPNDNETVHTAFNVKLSPTKHDTDLCHNHRPSTHIIEDWVSDSEDDSEPEILHNVPSFVQPTEQVKPSRPSVQHVETSILAVNPKPVILKSKSQGKRRNRKACFVCKSLTHLIKDCDFY